jgi:hypothetical protein
MSGIFAEYRRLSTDGTEAEAWTRLGPFSTHPLAKAECKKLIKAEPHNASRMEFRTVANDDRWTIHQECKPPHGTRLRWTNAWG